MQSLKEKNPNIWQFFEDKIFSVRINHVILRKGAKGVDHADELNQKRKKDLRTFNRYCKTG